MTEVEVQTAETIRGDGEDKEFHASEKGNIKSNDVEGTKEVQVSDRGDGDRYGPDGKEGELTAVSEKKNQSEGGEGEFVS